MIRSAPDQGSHVFAIADELVRCLVSIARRLRFLDAERADRLEARYVGPVRALRKLVSALDDRT